MINIFCYLEIKSTFAQNFNQITNQKTNQMKKLTKSVLAILVVASSFTACKKGEGDPAISLRSRTSRVAGEWTVDAQDMKSNYSGTSTGSSGYTGSSTEKITPTTYSKTDVTGGTTSTTTGTVATHKWTFEKDGTFTHEFNYTTKKTDDDSGSGVTDITETTDVHTIKESGVWNFLGGVMADTKNKEEMSVSVTNSSHTTATTTVSTFGFGGTNTVTTSTSTTVDTDTDEPNSNVAVWKITTLKNKEMAVEAVGKSTSNSTTTFTGGSFSSTSNSDYTTTISLTQE